MLKDRNRSFMAMNDVTTIFNEALAALNARETAKAETKFRQVLTLDPSHVPALNLLTVALMSVGRFADAEPFIARAVKLNQNSDVSHYNYGLIAKHMSKFNEASEQFTKALKLNPNVAETWNNRGTVWNDLKRFDAAISDFDSAIKLNRNYAEAHANKGKSLGQLGRHEEAFVAYDRALSIKPGLAEAWIGRGDIFLSLKRYDEAVAAYDRALSIRPGLTEAWLGRADTLFFLKRYNEAIAAYDKTLSLKPNLADAWLGRGNILSTDAKGYEEALTAYEKALSIKPDLEGALLGRGNVLRSLKRYEEASAAYERALSFAPSCAEAWLGRGNVFDDLKHYGEAMAAYDKALSIKPDLAEGWLGRGNVLDHLKRPEEALAAYERAVSLRPGLADAWLGRGNVLCSLKRYDEALAAYDNVLSVKPNSDGAWLGHGNVLVRLKRYEEAIAAFDRALSLDPSSSQALLGRGHAFTALNLCDQAFAAVDRVLAVNPDMGEAWLGRGDVFVQIRRYEEALAAFDRALECKPDLPGAWLRRGGALSALKRHGEAIVAFDRSLESEPDGPFAESFRLHAKMQLCDWSNFASDCAHLRSSMRSIAAEPFSLLAVEPSPEEQRWCGQRYSEIQCPPPKEPIWRGERRNHERIRVAYLSADYGPHPVFHLLSGVLASHDHERFETFAISFGSADPAGFSPRLTGSFDRFLDVRDRSDTDVARLLKALEIDIAIDLMGYTDGARPMIFAHRAVPVQISYLGFPGTMGADHIDYIIADRWVIPEEQRQFYSEKAIYMPNTFQANDSERKISDLSPSRAAAGLPDNGFVFCVFNNSYKITPDVFDVWMRVLQQVPGSVLWLLAANTTVEGNLRREAAARGVEPERLVFAPRISYADYLARYQLADLFLDTLPFNAGTTASDALWAGLPLITCPGRAFASRMAVSLLRAVGMAELVAGSMAEYEALAVKLGSDPQLMASTRAKLARNRLSEPLFDTKLFTRHLEAAYVAVHERVQAGLPPDHVYVAG